MPKYMDAWKKVKPKGFDDKILVEALKELERAQGVWSKSPNRENLMAMGGATKNAVRATEAAMKSAAKEQKALQWLQHQLPSFKASEQQTTILQRGLVSFYQELEKRRKELLLHASGVATRPNLQVAATAQKQFQDFGAWLNKEGGIYSGDLVRNLGIMGSRAEVALKEIGKTLGDLKNAKPEDKKKLDAQLKGFVADLAGVAKRLAAPMKEEQIKVKRPEGAFIPGGS